MCQCLDQDGDSLPTPGLAQEGTNTCWVERLGAGVNLCVARYMSPAWDGLWVVKAVQPVPRC